MIKKIQELYAILSRMSKREKTILYAAAFFISLTLLDRMMISPIFNRISSLESEIKEKESNIKKSMRILSQKDKIMSESESYGSVFSQANSEEEEMTSILKEIENLASKSSVYLIDMKPGGAKSAGSAKKYIINLSCEAQIEQLTQFMYDIENSSKLLTIEKYQIGPKSKESSVARCSMSISKISM
ncbi:MAG: type 4a pilus biogenesis protein PilO [Candidatus Omnitrophota bacterium]